MTRCLSLAEYIWLAEQVAGIEAVVLAKAARIELADSALHAPSASFGGEEFYPEVIDKAAVLTCRLAWNHPLPDGNKRAPWAALVLFLDLHGVTHEEGWYVARALEVEVTSQGRTAEEALASLREALELYFEDEVLPEVIEPPLIATVQLSA
ncbi:MAG: type II toxin-antitoxin system death-on-curing family toxin [Acidimicrobiales bacterium]